MSKWTLEGTDIYNGIGFIDLNDPKVLKKVVHCVNHHEDLMTALAGTIMALKHMRPLDIQVALALGLEVYDRIRESE